MSSIPVKGGSLDKYKVRCKEHLFNLISNRNNSIPNFALLLGAGASISSNVKSTNRMIEDWKFQLYKNSKSTEPYRQWVKNEKWPDPSVEYSELFEMVYDQPAQRRNYIEECIIDAHPNMGYIYLANIISENYFNVIFTPNFDDLINEACFAYTPNCKPIVCAHDSAVSGIRITSKRPKIIKLHGDFLYDNIKNTRKETDSLEKNMREKLAQFAVEYGLVVIGYSGNDYSIMEILEQLLRSDNYFPHGIYWCLRKGSQISTQLDRLLSKERVYTVVIDSFDEFMADLHKDLNLILPDNVKDPYKAVTGKLNGLILNRLNVTSPIIKNDLKEIIKQVKKYEPLLSKDLHPEESPVPYQFLGSYERDNLNFPDAIEYLKKALRQLPRDLSILSMIGSIYTLEGMSDQAYQIIEQLETLPKSGLTATYMSVIVSPLNPERANSFLDSVSDQQMPNFVRVLIFIDKSNNFLMMKKYEEAISEADKALKLSQDAEIPLLNKAWALKGFGHTEDAKKIIEKLIPLIQASQEENRYLLLGSAYCLLNDTEKMVSAFENSFLISKFDTLYAMSFDPDYECARTTPEFTKLLTTFREQITKLPSKSKRKKRK